MISFLGRFEDVVASRPGAHALTDAQESVSYEELNRRAIIWSTRLVRRGVRRGDVVAVEAGRTAATIAVILGAWRLGAPCMPYAAATPERRLRQMFDQTKPTVTVADCIPDGWSPDGSRLPLTGDTEPATPGQKPAAMDLNGEELAYVLFTSGSTGIPKAVAMPHASIFGLIDWQIQHDTGTQRTTQFAPLYFDVAFQELMSTLGSGGELVMVAEEARHDPSRLLALVEAANIDRIFLPTAALAPFCRAATGRHLSNLRDVIVAGEQLKITEIVRDLFGKNPHIRLHNQYGPCETHVVTTYTMTGPAQEWPVLPPIGRPLPHVRITVTDSSDGRDDRSGVGELVIHGSCVAAGYYRDPERTRERFDVDPLGAATYQTGDLVREGNDGLVFCGRADQQVKIRGHRIELEEIEVVIDEHPELIRSAVRSVEVAGTTVLAAYVEAELASAVVSSSTRLIRRFEPNWTQHVLARLPEYMVPSVWLEVDRLPLTPTGKVDRLALPPAPTTRPAMSTTFARPLSTTEQRIAGVWGRVLGIDVVGLDDPFFDLGGSSLLAATVVADLREEYGFPLATSEAYQYPTVRALAQFVDGSTAKPTRPVRRSARPAESDEGVAVIGIGCRFPGASTPSEFWSNLTGGVESIRRAGPGSQPQEKSAASRAVPSSNTVVHAAGVLGHIETFDAAFFGLRTREAALIDPQHRLFLECCVEALDDAGLTGREGVQIGVFAGCGPSTYLLNNVLPSLSPRPRRNLIDSVEELELLMATGQDFIASRVAYLLNCTGPTVNVNAACATSLVAIHQARIALLRGECDLALAGAAAVSVPQIDRYTYEPAMMYSPDGRCRPYDADAAGTVFSNGVGAIALKRLSDARADGDLVYAVLAGSAVGNDGAAKMGMTAPSTQGQASVIAAAWADSGVAPQDVGFVEGHGTATPVGDDVELTALAQVFDMLPPRSSVLGSVKSNVGHLGWAAGMAGIIKTVLAVAHAQIPPTVNFQQPCDRLTEPTFPFRVTDVATLWSGPARIAGVSAFGLGGVNAHVVVTSMPSVHGRASNRDQGIPKTYSGSQKQPAVTVAIPVSARSRIALQDTVAQYQKVFTDADPDITAVAHTAATGRRHFEWRVAFVGDSAAGLERSRSSTTLPTTPVAPGRIVGVFSGQGGEYPGMGQRLAEICPAYGSAVDKLAPLFQDVTGHQLADALALGRNDGATGSRSIALIQPLVFLTQMAMVELWRSLGVEFDLVMGHSLGEFAAACTAGVFSVEDGMRLVAERGRLLQSLPADAGMAVLFQDEHDTRKIIKASGLPLEISALNAPLITAVSGARTVLENFATWASARQLDARLLTVNRAGHSSLMEPILDELDAAAQEIRFLPADRPVISNVSGKLAGPEMGTAQYWRDHLRQPVRFADGVLTTAAMGVSGYVEIGGHSVLSPLVVATRPDFTGPVVSTLRRGERDDTVLAHAVAALYTAGATINWSALPGATSRRVRLPVYPFARSRAWVDSPTPAADTSTASVPALPTSETPERQWQYQIKWNPTDLVAGAESRRWLLVHDGSATADAIADRLVELGHLLTQTPHIDSAQVGRFDEVIVCAVGSNTSPADPVAAVRDPLSAFLASANASSSGTSARTTVLTQLAQPVLATQPTRWPFAALVGALRVARNELGRQAFRSIDIEPETDPARLVDALCALGGGEIAHRGTSWYSPTLSPAANSNQPPLPVAADKTYLVVGGLRGLGLWSAEQLVEAGARHLSLIGRTAPGEEESGRLAALRSIGVAVDVHLLDITDEAKVATVVQSLSRSADLGGVLYCAGVLHDGVLSEVSWESFEQALRAKAIGASALLDAIDAAGLLPEFIVLYSSATSVLGNPGQGAHGAANAMLDAFAHHQRESGRPVTAVNWGPWRDDGFLRDRPALRERLDQSGMGLITNQDGARLFRRMLHGGSPQVAFLANDWTRYLDGQDLSSDPFYREVAPSDEGRDEIGGDVCRQIAAAAGDQQRDLVRRTVDEAVGTVLGEVDGGTFLDQGLDSLSAIRLRNSLAAKLSCSLPMSVAFDHASADRLTDFLTTSVLDQTWRDQHDDSRGSRQVADGRAAQIRPSTAPVMPGPADAQEPGIPDYLPWSMQQRRWSMLIEGAAYGHRVVPIVFGTALDETALLDALHHMIGRHEALRYRYADTGCALLDPKACVPDLATLLSDVTNCTDEEGQQRIAAIVQDLRTHVPDLRHGPSWTLRCVRTRADEFVILLSLQHIDFDGTGLTVFVEELRDIYHARRAGVPVHLPTPVGYSEFVAWQEATARQQRGSVPEFFRGLFAGVPVTTALPDHHGFEVTRALPSARFTPDLDLSPNQLKHAAARLHVSPFALVLGAYATTVSEIVNSSPVVISAISSGRTEDRFLRTVGPFTAPLPMPLHAAGCDPDQMALQANSVSTAVNGRAPLMPITDLLDAVPCFNRFPFDTYFSDVAINFTNYRQVTGAPAAFEVEVLEILGPVDSGLFSQVDFGHLTRVPGLHLVFDASGTHCRPNFWVHTGRFSPTWVERISDRFTGLLTAHVRTLLK